MLVFIGRDPVVLRAKFHVVSSLLIILKIAILMLACQCPKHSIEK